MTLNLTEKKSSYWPTTKELIVQKLDPNYDSEYSVEELFNIKQESVETISEYSERLDKLMKTSPACMGMPDAFKEKLTQYAFIRQAEIKTP